MEAGHADQVMSLNDISGEIQRSVNRPSPRRSTQTGADMTTSQALSDDALSFVCTLVKDRAAIELENSKSYLIEARLAPLARRRGYGSAAELIQVVRKQASMRLADEVVEAMTTNETSFFRDMHPFDALKKTFLPQLIGDGGRRRLRIWSAACSSGQELYSIAILIREHFPELLQWDLELLGTDICDEVLNKAKQGRYPQVEVNRGMPASLLVKYFERQGMNWGLRPEIRQMAQFRKMNLIRAWPITGRSTLSSCAMC